MGFAGGIAVNGGGSSGKGQGHRQKQWRWGDQEMTHQTKTITTISTTTAAANNKNINNKLEQSFKESELGQKDRGTCYSKQIHSAISQFEQVVYEMTTVCHGECNDIFAPSVSRMLWQTWYVLCLLYNSRSIATKFIQKEAVSTKCIYLTKLFI